MYFFNATWGDWFILFSYEREWDEPDLDIPGANEAIKQRLADGDEAAWFTACCKVMHMGTELEAVSYLGGCNYRSFEDFTRDDYAWDMIRECMLEVQTIAEEELDGMAERSRRLKAVINLTD